MPTTPSTRTSCRTQRIVYTYDMRVDQTRLSVSLVTVEFKPQGDGTRLVFTEQVAGQLSFANGWWPAAGAVAPLQDPVDRSGLPLYG
jgi:uncharacterized protein YndB with AHSA1/START domain